MSTTNGKLSLDAQRLEALLKRKRELEEQIARHEIRNERVLVLFTKTNIERMQRMADELNTSRNDLLNKLVEHAYLTGLVKEPLKTDDGVSTKSSPRRGVSSLKKAAQPEEKPHKQAVPRPAVQTKKRNSPKKKSQKPRTSVK